MTFRFYHSLASRAAVSVVVSLWYHEDIDSLKGGYDEGREEYLETQSPSFTNSPIKVGSARRIRRLALHSRVKNSVSELFMPESVRRYLLEFVQIIGENLEDWIKDHCFTPNRSVDSFRDVRLAVGPNKYIGYISHGRRAYGESGENSELDVRNVLRWSPDGEIDLEKTGEALVRNESDPIKRFRLAIDYCREDEILRLWPTHHVQDHFSQPEAWISNMSYDKSSLFWWRYFRHYWPESTFTYLLHLESTVFFEETSLFTAELYCSCFSSSVDYCSPLAVYLSNKIRAGHSDNIVRFAEGKIAKKRFGVILFRMPETSHAQLLRDSPEQFLKQLLFWRHESFFVDTVERNWNIFGQDLFDSILFHIVEGIQWYEESDIYKSIFRWFWNGSPGHLRDVERIFYDRRVCGRTTLRDFAVIHFSRSPTAEETMKSLLFEGQHVLEVATRVRVRDVLADIVRACLPAEEWDATLKMLITFCDISEQNNDCPNCNFALD